MNLLENYDKAALHQLNSSYSDVLDNPKKFLLQLLNKYNLNTIIDINDICEKLPKNRTVHIVNLLLSRDFLFSKILEMEFPGTINEETLYEWDILSLAHDLAYIYETVTFSTDIFTIDDLCKKLKLRSFFTANSTDLFYSPSTYINYFRYKRNEFGVCDHGIIAAILLNNYFNEAGVIPEQLSLLAHVIASHNIFTADMPSEEIYSEYSLYELIPSSPLFKRLPVEHNKYAYYYLCLCMLDILEPINAFDLSGNELQFNLLRNLSYEATNLGIAITSSCGGYIEHILKRIYNIPIWMNVSMTVYSPNKLELCVVGP